MTDKPVTTSADNLPRPVVRRARLGTGWWIWLIPLLAALVGLSLVVHEWLQAGPRITISFRTAEGLIPGKTPVKYKSFVIGKVDHITLSPDHFHVMATVDLDKNARDFATVSTRFWIARPRIGLKGVSGVSTLLSGAYISADIGGLKTYQDRFEGMELPPVVLHGARGHSFILHASNLGSLDVGSPVYYRHIKVGRIASYHLGKRGSDVTLHIFVDSPNDHFVTTETRFWNASGLAVSLDTRGLKLNMQSWATILTGGVAFQVPPGKRDSTPAKENASFHLFEDKTTAMEAFNGPPQYMVLRFDQPLRGLTHSTPVEFLGVNFGKVVSTHLDYNQKTRCFSVIVRVVVYPKRLGQIEAKLANLAKAQGKKTDFPHLMTALVARGLRARVRMGNLLTYQPYIDFDFFPEAAKVHYNPDAQPLTLPTAPVDFGNLSQQLNQIAGKINQIPFDRLARHLDTALLDLDSTLSQINQTLVFTRHMMDNDSPLQQNLVHALNELSRMARSLRVLSDYLSVYPSALIYGRSADPALSPTPHTPAVSTLRGNPGKGSKP